MSTTILDRIQELRRKVTMRSNPSSQFPIVEDIRSRVRMRLGTERKIHDEEPPSPEEPTRIEDPAVALRYPRKKDAAAIF